MTPRRQVVDMGGFRAVKTGAPSVFADLYYTTMEMRWPAFVGAVAAIFLAVNLLFALIYLALPGSVANVAPGSLADRFFFSVETLGTVGYGEMAPATRAGHVVAAVEILTGLFFSATVTGLIFARFARPRDSFVFSRVAVLGELDGRRTLMLRLASTRARPMMDVVAQIAWLERVDLPDGRVFRRLTELPLVRARNPMMALSWTLSHAIEDGSPMLAALDGEGEFRLTVTVSGLDTLLATQAIGGCSYRRDQILIDHEFADAVSEEGGLFHLDLRKLGTVRPMAAAQVQ
jgi:inward rectifier potassium channel